MLKQSTQPMEYGRTLRPDNASIITSIPAGVVAPISVVPLHRGDSASGRFVVDMELAEMPAPLENAVLARVQAWIVPRPSLPQFSGLDEYTHSYHGTDITQLGSAARTPPSLFSTVGTGAIAAAQASEFFKTLGLYLVSATAINTDYIDAYNLIQNFRLAAHSSKMTRYDYYSEDATTSLELKPAFWPRNRMHNIVADYEQALVKGSLDLDVASGSIPIKIPDSTGLTGANQDLNVAASGVLSMWNDTAEELFGDMTGITVPTSLADIDKARVTNQFAKRIAQMDGANYSGFNNDDVLVAEMMQGFSVPDALWNRPWLIDNKTVVFGMQERHATDAANLDDSVSTGRASAVLSFNVPTQNYGAIGMLTVEVMPERLYERQSDEYLYCTDVDDLPNAMRDIMRVEPVDTVLNRRVDAAHTTPSGTYGYEPMNAKWKRERTTMGGEFRQTTPGTPITTARTAIWQADYVDPALTSDHWLCPHPFPQNVFSVPANDICNVAVRQEITIIGHTQFGDDLVEDNSEFVTVEAEKV